MQPGCLSGAWQCSAAAHDQSCSAFTRLASQVGRVCPRKNQRAGSSQGLLMVWKLKFIQPPSWRQPGGNVSRVQSCGAEREGNLRWLPKSHLNFSVVLLQITPLGAPCVGLLEFGSRRCPLPLLIMKVQK